ncbi:uncharacterized protein LOC101862103 [Aplysia californica]|uniref:Uncharacterized protein LOC101862103 n=1 Tax=Aplysia californica TaxID=6500 RepID=A0ABM0ZVW5_APLCA|nr:uncharacterized protein LOC101862103 [Aplysia californica]XP_035824589.1 uncharacterized protein LOC101862103 [Aplysia californica]
MVSSKRIQVTLTGGAPWGFRLAGGGSLPLTINKIRKKSRAHTQGLLEGDAVISINGVPVHDKSQDEALELVENAGDSMALEIFRGDVDELSATKPKKPIQIMGGGAGEGNSGGGLIMTSSMGDVSSSGVDTVPDAPSELILVSSVDNVTSDSYDQPAGDVTFGGLQLTATVDDVSGSTFNTGEDTSSSGLIMTASVDDVTSSTNDPVFLESSPVISTQFGDVTSNVEDFQSSSTLTAVMAEPFTDSARFNGPSPTRLSPLPPKTSPKPSKSPSISPQPPPQIYSPKPTQSQSPQPPKIYSPVAPPQSVSPKAPPVSPKPQASVSPLPQPRSPQPPPVSPKPSRTTSSAATATFDDGQTRREVTREQHVTNSEDGRSNTVVQKETTTTTSTNKRGPSFVKSQASAFNSVQPTSAQQISQRTTTTSTTVKSTTNNNNNNNNNINNGSFKVVNNASKASIQPPTPLSASTSSNFLQQRPQPTTTFSSSFSSDTIRSNTNVAPVFKPTRFVPGSGTKKEVPGLFSPPSSQAEVNVSTTFMDGKENVSPQRMFQVKNIVPGKPKSSRKEMWKPNVWLPDQKPSTPTSETTHVDDFSPYSSFPVPSVKPGISLVEQQKRKLVQSQVSRNTDYEDDFDDEDFNHKSSHRHSRPHVFAPPVEIHARSDHPDYEPYSPEGEPYHDDDYYYEDPLLSSPDSSVIRRRSLKKQYADSAFYNTPGKSYPTIDEQMKLCKTIAQSLTSNANKRARGAKMFMRRKRKSNKWVHEGHSEWSSSAGDVANILELDSELSPDEGGNKPLFYFKIPNLKGRAGKEGKQTKMALTQDQFEKLRLSSKKCEHRNVAPDTCFDIVADLKAHKGRGGRMFERRKQRSDKFVIDEQNARAKMPSARLENVLSQPVRQEKTPWEAAMAHGGNVDAAFNHLSEMERNQKLNQILKYSPPKKLQTTPLPPGVQSAPLPHNVCTSLKGGPGPTLIKGKDFNRTARGWGGGDEYPVADRLLHISPTRTFGPDRTTDQVVPQQQQQQSPQQQQQQYADYNNRVRGWQNPGQSPYVGAPEPAPEPEQWDYRRQPEWQAHQPEPEDWRGNQWGAPSSVRQQQRPEQQRPVSWQSDDYGTVYRDEYDYNYVPVDNRFGSGDYPPVAYMQPIIPGTDL